MAPAPLSFKTREGGGGVAGGCRTQGPGPAAPPPGPVPNNPTKQSVKEPNCVLLFPAFLKAKEHATWATQEAFCGSLFFREEAVQGFFVIDVIGPNALAHVQICRILMLPGLTSTLQPPKRHTPRSCEVCGRTH